MKDSNFYKLMIGESHFIKDTLIVSKEEVHFLEIVHRLKMLGDYLRHSHYIPMDSGYNVRDVIRSPTPPTLKKKKKK
jgi:hypothetical protein